MVERRQPPVSELALADALERLVVMIEELRIDVGLRVAVTIDDTQMLKLTFSGTPDTGFPLHRGSARYPPRRWSAASGTRDCAATRSSSFTAGVSARREPAATPEYHPLGWRDAVPTP